MVELKICFIAHFMYLNPTYYHAHHVASIGNCYHYLLDSKIDTTYLIALPIFPAVTVPYYVMNHFSTKLVIMKNTTYILRRIKNKTLV
jgi:hypothetical protein